MNIMKRFSAKVAAAAASIVLAGPATAGMTVPEPEVRLIVPGGPVEDGVHRIALEIRLPDDYHTYWRNPGESGLPPTFDTSGSGNVEAFTVDFPAPHRWSDGVSTSLVYEDVVVLPITVTAADPAQPARLSLGIDLGYCHEICVPWRADISAVLDPDAPPEREAAAVLDAALAAIPVGEDEAPAGSPRIASIERRGDTPRDAVLTIAVEADDPGAVDLFAEPPDGWYLAVPRRIGTEPGRALFELPLKGMPKRAAFSGAAFRFTVTGGPRAVEIARTLD
jgi:DsbC/DsbD-like thiol-disulfide interchange protein